MKVLSVNIGDKRTVQWGNKTVETGIFKFPTESIQLGLEDVVGDSVVNRIYHGGVDKACYLYAADHYDYWREKYPNTVSEYGAMGENITIEGLDERKLNVGDTFQLGEAIVQISEHREPCYKLNIRLNEHSGIKDFIALGHCGTYCRVLKQGEVKPGDEMLLIEKGTSASIFDIFSLIYKKSEDRTLLESILKDPLITDGTKEELSRVWGLSEK